jgi:hypothetical protein
MSCPSAAASAVASHPTFAGGSTEVLPSRSPAAVDPASVANLAPASSSYDSAAMQPCEGDAPVSKDELCKLCREESPEARNARMDTRPWKAILGHERGWSCCFEDTAKKAWEADQLRYKKVAGRGAGLIPEMLSDLTVSFSLARFAQMQSSWLLQRVTHLELQLQVLLDMKRMGDIDAENGSLKRKRRDSV